MRALLLAVALTAIALPATASVLVVGNGMAADCSKAAYKGRADKDSILLCSRSLDEESLNRRDRAGTLVGSSCPRQPLGRPTHWKATR